MMLKKITKHFCNYIIKTIFINVNNYMKNLVKKKIFSINYFKKQVKIKKLKFLIFKCKLKNKMPIKIKIQK